jgi:hypothetical protein
VNFMEQFDPCYKIAPASPTDDNLLRHFRRTETASCASISSRPLNTAALGCARQHGKRLVDIPATFQLSQRDAVRLCAPNRRCVYEAAWKANGPVHPSAWRRLVMTLFGAVPRRVLDRVQNLSRGETTFMTESTWYNCPCLPHARGETLK